MLTLGACWDCRKQYCKQKMSWDLSGLRWNLNWDVWSLSYDVTFLLLTHVHTDFLLALPTFWRRCPCNPCMHSVEMMIFLMSSLGWRNILLTLRSQIEEYCSYFTARFLSINAICYSFILQLSLWLGTLAPRLSSKYKPILDFKSLQLKITNAA